MRKQVVNTTTTSKEKKKIRPALTPEARENQMISLAYDLVEQRLLDGTATSQETTFFLKMGSERERLERETMRKNQELIEAKKENLASAKSQEELYLKALAAMRTYSGNDSEGDPDGNPF